MANNHFRQKPEAILDIGTAATTVLLVGLNQNNLPILLSYARFPSEGVINGQILNIETVSRVVTKSISEAERMAGIGIQDVTICFSGKPPLSKLARKTIVLDQSPVTNRTVLELQRSFQKLQKQKDYFLLQTIPYQYRLDDSPPIKNPLGLLGHKLSLDMALHYEDENALRTYRLLLQRCRLKLNGFIDQSLAAALAMLTAEEQHLGAISLHMGAGTTNIALLHNYCPIFLNRLPIGGQSITEDLAKLLGITLKEAETIKCQLPNIMEESIDTLELKDRSIPTRQAIEIVHAKLHIILQTLKNLLQQHYPHYRQIPIFALSGGAAEINGFDKLIEQKFNKRVKTQHAADLLGLPKAILNQKHSFSSSGVKFASSPITAIGAAFYTLGQHDAEQKDKTIISMHKLQHKQRKEYPETSLWQRLWDWFVRNYI